jgi:hypothetical protein
MTAKTRKRLLVVVGAFAAVAVLLLHYKQRDSYRCQICFAMKDMFQWRLGASWGLSVPLTPSWERITETRFRQDLLPPDHVHDWMFAQGSLYHFFGTTWGGCAIGPGRYVSELCQLYEVSPEFRTFITQKMRDGSLPKSNVVVLISMPRTGEPSPLQKEVSVLMDTFFHDRPTTNL